MLQRVPWWAQEACVTNVVEPLLRATSTAQILWVAWLAQVACDINFAGPHLSATLMSQFLRVAWAQESCDTDVAGTFGPMVGPGSLWH